MTRNKLTLALCAAALATACSQPDETAEPGQAGMNERPAVEEGGATSCPRADEDGVVEIQGGLEAGMAVVSRGNESLRDGDIVIPQ